MQITPPLRSSRRGRQAVRATILAVLLVTLAAGCGGDGGKKTFSTPTYPYSFTYPADWKLTRNAAFSFGSDAGDRSVSVSLKDPYDQATITRYKLKKTLPAGVNGNSKEVDGIVARLTEQAKGTASDGKAVKYGGIPGYMYFVEYNSPDGTLLRNQLVFLFSGRNEYQINCQSTEKNRAELEKGCNLILDTLAFK